MEEDKAKEDILKQCRLCPRKCGVNRYRETGFCGVGTELKIARAALHYMEEPCISGKTGSGTVFFSGCNLKCCYCQNYTISYENFGKTVSVERLAEIFLELQEKGANNINLVTAVMYVPQILKSLDRYVDIYLADIKYFSDEPALKYSAAPSYFYYAFTAVNEMIRQRGKPEFYEEKVFDDSEAILKSGVIIRHLVIPGARQDSIKILNELAKRFEKEEYILSLMSQFTPHFKCREYKEINRTITSFEYDSVVKEALRLGLDNTYIQNRTSAKEEYTPLFNLEGC